LGPPVFIIYINDFPLSIKPASSVTTYVGDESVLVPNKRYNDFINGFNTVSSHICKWFQANQLTLNIDKTNFVKFTPTNRTQYPLIIEYTGKYLAEVSGCTFLGLIVDHHLNWKCHVDYISSKLSTLCYAIRKLSNALDIDSLGMVHFASVQSILEYGLIFSGNTSIAVLHFGFKSK
jgi:hypothetical protein